jgi:hypothetical protein
MTIDAAMLLMECETLAPRVSLPWLLFQGGVRPTPSSPLCAHVPGVFEPQALYLSFAIFQGGVEPSAGPAGGRHLG